MGRHNFFVFPRQELTFDPPAHEFLCQTTSMDFLAKYQFDFNTCIHEGASFLLFMFDPEEKKSLAIKFGIVPEEFTYLNNPRNILFVQTTRGRGK